MVKKGLAMSGKLGSEPLGKFYTVRNLRKDVNGEVSKIHGMTM